MRERLIAQGYTQRDLARMWGVSEASVTRFLQGTENADPPFSRAVRLGEMLRMSLDELAARMGLRGKVPLPPPTPVEGLGAPRIGTVSTQLAGPGRLRVLLHLDLPAEVAAEMVALLGRARPD
jgi:transcriptional regulator with XRE-family HTH domain